MIQARDPRSPYPAAQRLPLAARLTDPEHARITLIQTMPPGSGIEAPMEALRSALRARFPQARVLSIVRRDFMMDDPAERAAIVRDSDAAVVLLGPAATMVQVGWLYAAALEQAGLPVAVSVYAGYEAVADHVAEVRALPLRRAVVPAPPGSLDAVSAALIDALIHPLSPAEQATGLIQPLIPSRYGAEGSPEDVQRRFRDAGWTDGLPIIPPTDAAVQAMLAGTSRSPDDIVCATLRPEGLAVTVETAAINAVMAGAEPEHLPLVLAAVSLFGGAELDSMTRSVNSFAFSLLVSGPWGGHIGLIGGLNALGPGNWPNAAVARAVLLTLRNGGGLRVGVTSTPTQGNAAGLVLFAENTADSPWEPFQVGEGLTADTDAVSLFTGGLTIAGSFYYRGLDDAAEQMTRFDSPTGALLLVSAKRARILAEQGLSRRDVADHLWRKASGPVSALRANGFFPMMKAMIERAAASGVEPPWPPDIVTRPDTDIVPFYPRGGVKVAVVGGSGSSVMQLWHSSLHHTTPIAPWR